MALFQISAIKFRGSLYLYKHQKTSNPCDFSQGFDAGLVGNYMKMNGVKIQQKAHFAFRNIV